MSCWHCKDGACDCIVCGLFVRNPEGGSMWIAGECLACKRRAFEERNAAAFDQINQLDPRERKYWTHIPAHDGNPVKRIFLPEVGLK